MTLVSFWESQKLNADFFDYMEGSWQVRHPKLQLARSQL